MPAMSFHEALAAHRGSVQKHVPMISRSEIDAITRAEVRKAMQARPVTVETNAADPIQSPASVADALKAHVNSQRRVGETHAAATLRLATAGDPVLSNLYAAGRMQKGADTALASAHAAVADAVPVTKAIRTIEAATDAVIAKAGTEGRAMSRHAALRIALDSDPELYAAHRLAHRAARGL
jgi:hypothetical protein